MGWSTLDQVRMTALFFAVFMLFVGIAVGIGLGASVRNALRRDNEALQQLLDEHDAEAQEALLHWHLRNA